MKQNLKAAFLDRDGTIIVDKVYLNDPDKIEYLPDVFDGLKLLRDLGYMVIVVTNQSGMARGLVNIENLYEIHRRIRADFCRQGVDIAAFYYAPYSVESNHYLRKPNPGMLHLAAGDFGFKLSESVIIGDRDTDIIAGKRAGTKTIFLNHSFELDKNLVADHVCRSVYEGASWLGLEKLFL